MRVPLVNCDTRGRRGSIAIFVVGVFYVLGISNSRWRSSMYESYLSSKPRRGRTATSSSRAMVMNPHMSSTTSAS